MTVVKEVPQADFSNVAPVRSSSRLAFSTAPNAIITVAIDEVVPNPRNPRDDLGEDDGLLEELVESFQANGQIQSCPSVTRAAYLQTIPEDKERIGDASHVIITGWRRYEAAKQAGFTTIKLEVNDDLAKDRATLAAVTIDENTRRKDFTPMEEARAYKKFIDEFGGELGGQAAIARRLRRSPGYVSQRLTLLNLLPELQKLIDTGEMTLRAGRKIGTYPPEQQLAEWEKWGMPASPAPSATSETAAVYPVTKPETAHSEPRQEGPAAEPTVYPVKPSGETRGTPDDDPTPAEAPAVYPVNGKQPSAEPASLAAPEAMPQNSRSADVAVPLGSSPAEIVAVLRRSLDPETWEAVARLVAAEVLDHKSPA